MQILFERCLHACQFCKTESGCKAGDKCLFPHHKVDERDRSHKEKATTKNAVAVKLCHNWAVSRKTRSHWNLKEAQDHFDEHDSHSLGK